MCRLLIVSAFWLLASVGGAQAQSVPGPAINTACNPTTGANCTIWAPQDWINAWQAKQDYNAPGLFTTLGVSGAATFSGTLGVTGSSESFWPSAASFAGPTPPWYNNITGTGEASASINAFNKFGCNDGVDFVTQGGALSTGNCIFVIDNLAAGWTGARTAVNAQVNVLAAPGQAANNGNFISGMAASANADVNVGGTSSVKLGSIVSHSYETTLDSGATNWLIAEGWEGGVTINSGASVGFVNGGKITVTGCGVATCNGIAIGGDNNILLGLTFGSQESPTWPIASNGTLVGIQTSYTGAARTAAIGVDMSNATFSTGAFKSTGFLVDGSGNITGVGLSLSGQAIINYAADTALVLKVPDGDGALQVQNNSAASRFVLVTSGNGGWEMEDYGNGGWTADIIAYKGNLTIPSLTLTALPTSCSGQPSKTVAAIGWASGSAPGTLTLCP
jgi:hypothetical protein